MSDNWVVQNLQNALETWNEKLAEIWQLITTTPQDFKGGGIWGVLWWQTQRQGELPCG